MKDERNRYITSQKEKSYYWWCSNRYVCVRKGLYFILESRYEGHGWDMICHVGTWPFA
ncbi:hypothetical protein HanIR_Chr11g0538641 [Helianthus annuus]|nr:hypothetical protein HanIR_Chr11g0538641 [Helianthus annuus]